MKIQKSSSLKLKIILAGFLITSCGGEGGSSGSSSQPPPSGDRTAPIISFSPSTLSVISSSQGTSTLSFSDNVGVVNTPTVTCDNGGQFASSTFTAPAISVDTTVTCSAEARDAAGNSSTAILTVTVTAARGPTIVTKIDKSEVFESQLFIIDTNESRANGANIETTEYIQISGPPATLFRRLNRGSTQFRAPALDTDGETVISFEIRLTDTANAVSSEIIDLPVIGRSGPGTFVGLYDPAVTLTTGAGSTVQATTAEPFNVIATQSTTSSTGEEKSRIAFLGGPSFGGELEFNREDWYRVDGEFDDISYIGFDALAFNLRPRGDSFAVLSKESDDLRWFSDESEGDNFVFKERDSFSIEDPCYVTGRRDTAQDFIWVGQENKGFSVVQLERVLDAENDLVGFDEIIIDSVGEGRDLCHILPTYLPEDIVEDAQFINQSRFSPLIAIDYETNELVLYGDKTNTEKYEELKVIPLQTNTQESLKIVDVISTGTPSMVPRSMVVLLTSDVDDGVHRLVHIIQEGEDADEIVQRTYSWDSGVPAALVQGNFGGTRPNDQFVEDLVVISRTGNQSLFFDNRPRTTVFEQGFPSYAQPTFFETLPGAGSAVRVEQRSINPIEDIVVSYPETGELRLFTPDPNIPPFVEPQN